VKVARKNASPKLTIERVVKATEAKHIVKLLINFHSGTSWVVCFLKYPRILGITKNEIKKGKNKNPLNQNKEGRFCSYFETFSNI